MSRTTNDLVSVVVPMYNVEGTLADCLGSVLAQTHRALEVLCVNDGSTDGTLALARGLADQDGRIRVIDKPNGGYGSACNRGISEATGTWVAIVEPDDVLEPGCYEDLLDCAAHLGGSPNVDVAKAAYWRALPGPDEREVRVPCPYARRVRPRTQPFSIGDGVELLLHHPSIWSALYRLGYLQERGIRFVEAPGAGWTDNPFMAETLLRTDKIAYTDRLGYVYRERDLNEAESFARRLPLVPLTRWNEMWDVALDAHVTDPRVLEALAVRGVNYALVTSDAAQGAPGVDELVVRSMRRLPVGLVQGSSLISPAGKLLHARACELPAPRTHALRWYAHLVHEGLYRVRTNGVRFTLRTALSRRGSRLG